MSLPSDWSIGQTKRRRRQCHRRSRYLLKGVIIFWENYCGKRLDGRYEIREIIGVGGMAVVYKAYDVIDDRIVAIKILKEEFLANDEFRRRFKNESKAIAVLSHPNIVKVYDVSFGDRLQYIVMEYIEGITLKEYIEQQKGYKLERGCSLCNADFKSASARA